MRSYLISHRSIFVLSRRPLLSSRSTLIHFSVTMYCMAAASSQHLRCNRYFTHTHNIQRRTRKHCYTNHAGPLPSLTLSSIFKLKKTVSTALSQIYGQEMRDEVACINPQILMFLMLQDLCLHHCEGPDGEGRDTGGGHNDQTSGQCLQGTWQGESLFCVVAAHYTVLTPPSSHPPLPTLPSPPFPPSPPHPPISTLFPPSPPHPPLHIHCRMVSQMSNL